MSRRCKRKLTTVKFKKAVRKSNGNLSEIAKNAKVSRDTVEKKIKKYPHLQLLIDAEKEAYLDKAEKTLEEHIENGNTRMLQYYLTRKGKARGYGEEPKANVMIDNSKTENTQINNTTYDLSQLSMEELKALRTVSEKIGVINVPLLEEGEE